MLLETMQAIRSEFHLSYKEIADRYERQLSVKTSEWCGKPGSLRKERWVYILCDECYQKYLEKIIKTQS